MRSDARKKQAALCPCDQPNCSDAGLRGDVILATPDWLAERDARIRREAWDEGWLERHRATARPNPYRQSVEGGGEDA